MEKEEIVIKLADNHAEFIQFISTLNKSDFEYSVNSKWTAGQQLSHIILSIHPLVKIFWVPPFMLKLIFGKANRPSKDYDGLVSKYQLKINEGGKATASFVPDETDFINREKLIKKLSFLLMKLTKRIDGFSEKQLDELILPHPLLCKLTLREMMYFTIYHVQHHLKSTRVILKSKRQDAI